MEKESFPSNNVEFNTADLGAEQPAGDASFETLTADAKAPEAPASELDIVNEVMAEESAPARDDIDEIIEKSEKKIINKATLKTVLAGLLAGSALIGAGCDKDKNKNTGSTADPTAGTPKTESVSAVTDTSDKQNASSVDVSANAPLSNAPTSETEKSGKRTRVISAPEYPGGDFTEYYSDEIEVEYGDSNYRDFCVKKPSNVSSNMPGGYLDFTAYLESLGIDKSKLTTSSSSVYLGNPDTDSVAVEFNSSAIYYYVNGSLTYKCYCTKEETMETDGVLLMYQEDGRLKPCIKVHARDLNKTFVLAAMAYKDGQTTSPYAAKS